MGLLDGLKRSALYKKLAGIKSAIGHEIQYFIPDILFILWQYQREVGRLPNLISPKRFTEKLQWLKLYGQGERYTAWTDKYEVRNYVRDRLGEGALTKLIAVYDKVEDIDFHALPRSFVLKCTHGSGQNIICKDKSKLDVPDSVRLLKYYMDNNLYWYGRERCYKNIVPRIVSEEYLEEDGGAPLDYKFFCFNGDPKVILACKDRFKGLKLKYFDLNWKPLEATIKGHADNSDIAKPQCLSRMIDHARKLSEGIPFVRVDFYNIADKVYFGEMTFYPSSGYAIYEPDDFDFYLGEFLKLPKPSPA